jgi:endonuclease-8
MPEGDTVHRLARALSRELVGRSIDQLHLRDHGPVPELAGRTIEAVEAMGKHTIIRLAGGWSVRVHLGMKGRWRRLHVRERRPRHSTLVLVVGETAYACHGAYRAELVRTGSIRRHPAISRLGPDLLAEPPDIDGAVRRARNPAYADREVGDLLLDQRVVAGIGNVYKSEVLFECRVHPRRRVGSLEPAEVRSLLETAASLMRMSLRSRRRTHVPLRRRPTPSSPRLWVYGRAGAACLECGTTIERIAQGDMARTTYFCPRCQPDLSAATTE